MVATAIWILRRAASRDDRARSFARKKRLNVFAFYQERQLLRSAEQVLAHPGRAPISKSLVELLASSTIRQGHSTRKESCSQSTLLFVPSSEPQSLPALLELDF